MRYLLDSDTINYILKERPLVIEHLRQARRSKAEFVLSPVVDYQITRYLGLRGAHRMLRFYARLTSLWARPMLDEQDWQMAVDLWIERHRAGRLIEDADLLIAVTARRTGAVLVTNNERHFEELGVTVENWAASP